MVKELGMDNTVNTKGGRTSLKKIETVCPVVGFEKKSFLFFVPFEIFILGD